MKKFILLLLLLCVSIGYAQEKSITIDYTIDYLIPSKRKNTTDTITIGFDKSGKYLWTDSQYLANNLRNSVFKGNKNLMEGTDPELCIILNTETMAVMMFFTSGKNQMFMDFELSSLMPFPKNPSGGEEFELISKNTEETVEIAGQKATVYDIYPSHEENEIISIAFDESKDINNNKLFKKFFELIFAAEGTTSLLDMDFPNGLIMSISNKGEILMKAHEVDTKAKTININYSFKITE